MNRAVFPLQTEILNKAWLVVFGGSMLYVNTRQITAPLGTPKMSEALGDSSHSQN
jgi:hypothetical protein